MDIEYLKTNRFLTCLILIAITLIIFFAAIYLSQYGLHMPPADDKLMGSWGTFGDYFGGVLNPVLGFCSFMALLYTVDLQNKQLKKTDEQLEQNRIALEQNAEALKLNNQELQNSNEQLQISAKAQAEMEKTQKLQQFEGLFTHMASELSRIYQELDENSKKIENYLVVNMSNFTKDFQEGLENSLRTNFKLVRFFMYLYQTLQHIESLDETIFEYKFKKRYSNIIRASLGNEMLQLIYLNCLVLLEGDNSFNEYKRLITKYEFLEHMTFKIRLEHNYWLIYLSQFYNEKVFGKSFYFQEIKQDSYFQKILSDKRFSDSVELLKAIINDLKIEIYSVEPSFLSGIRSRYILKVNKSDSEFLFEIIIPLRFKKFHKVNIENLELNVLKHNCSEAKYVYRFDEARLINFSEDKIIFSIKPRFPKYALKICLNKQDNKINFEMTENLDSYSDLKFSEISPYISKFFSQ